MNKDIIIATLVKRGYGDRNAAIVTDELLKLSEELMPLFENWLSREEKKDFISHGISLVSLQSERGMTYPAALLTIDWIIKEPEKAIQSLKKGTR